MSPDKDQKFMQEDLPKILDAIKDARESRRPSRVTIEVTDTGGINSVQVESKKKYK